MPPLKLSMASQKQ